MSLKNILVKCPNCERVYIDWQTSAITPQDNPSTVCSKCGHRSLFKDLTEIKGLFQRRPHPDS